MQEKTTLRIWKELTILKVLVLCLVSHISLSQNESVVPYKEDILLHIANEEVSDKEVLFKAYILASGPLQNEDNVSKVLYVELIDADGSVIKKQFHSITNSEVIGSLIIPKKVKSGKYALRAYTRWMLTSGKENYTAQPIWINPSSKNSIAPNQASLLSVLPEGGNLIYDIENKLIIRTTSQNAIQGKIIDETNATVAHITGYDKGLGIVHLIPRPNKQYWVLLDNGERYEIANIQEDGYVLRVNNMNRDIARVRIISSLQPKKDKPTLIGTIDGVTFFRKELTFSNKNTVDIELKKQKIPKGILDLQLISDDNKILAYRPIWIDGPSLKISLESSSSDELEITQTIKVTDENDKPVATNLALSAARDMGKELVETETVQWLDIASTHTRNVDKKNLFLRDLHLLSKNTRVNSLEKKSKFQSITTQKGLEIIGKAFNLENRILRNTKVQVIVQSDNEILVEETTTDDDGILKLENLQVQGDAKIIFRTTGDETKQRLVKLELLDEIEQIEKTYENTEDTSPSVDKKNENLKDVNSTKDFEDAIALEEVKIKGSKKERKKLTPSVYGIEVPKNRVKFQDYERPQSIPQLLSQVAGVIVTNMNDINPTISVPRASGRILFVIDGFPLSQGSAPSSLNPTGTVGALGGPSKANLGEIMNLLNASDIERIELLLGADASIYGSRGGGGVIAFYTRNGAEYNSFSRKEGTLEYRGYEPQVTFATYTENQSKRVRKKDPLLFWKTNIKTNDKGIATLKFPIQEDSSKVRLKISAMAEDGRTGSGEVVLEYHDKK